MEGTPNRPPPHLSVFARALPLYRSLQLSFTLRILLAQAHTFNVVEVTGHRRFSSVSLTMSKAKQVSSRSVGFRTYLAIVTGGFCTCLAIVPVSAAVFHLRMLHCTGLGVRSQRSKIGPKISQISRYIRQIGWRFEIDRPKGLKREVLQNEFRFRFRKGPRQISAGPGWSTPEEVEPNLLFCKPNFLFRFGAINSKKCVVLATRCIVMSKNTTEKLNLCLLLDHYSWN